LDKIRDEIAKFPAVFGLRAFPGDVFRISPWSSFETTDRKGRSVIMLYTERKTADGWRSFAKGTPDELRMSFHPIAEEE
jgi:hypothetical protein